MTLHELKCWPSQFEAIAGRDKTHEFRRDDGRDFQPDDWLYLRVWHPDDEQFTGEAAMAMVSHVTRGPDFDVPEGFVVMSISLMGLHYNQEPAPLDNGAMTGGAGGGP